MRRIARVPLPPLPGITTQDPVLMAGLHVPTKAVRVARFQAETVHTAIEITGAAPRPALPALRKTCSRPVFSL